MTPTDAQIEAAAREIFDSAVGIKQWDNEFYSGEKAGCFDAARAALTAAAFAAAEAELVKTPTASSEAILVELEGAVARTIERCAQIAENFVSFDYDQGQQIAASIRALKDKPTHPGIYHPIDPWP